MAMTQSENRTEYRSEHGIAAWWSKDGAWHIALPVDKNGTSGNFRWADAQYNSRDEAIEAIEAIANVFVGVYD